MTSDDNDFKNQLTIDFAFFAS